MDRFHMFLILSAAASAYAADSQPAQATRRLEVSASAATSGACSALLPDGRSFITGGRASAEPLSVARYFERNGTVSPAASMLAARTGHICIALADGAVLVAGGEANSAEIYHPDTNTWASTGDMLSARKGATAVLLKNGMALVAGGEVSGKPTNTLEIYDPAQGRFDSVPRVLPAARAGYGLAVLEDGRVLIAGGLDGELPLDSIDMFDPEMGRLYPAGRMLSPRARFTATRLAGGKVLFAGGTDGSGELASAELYDPATGAVSPTEPMASPRQGHIAIHIAGSDRVLIAAGTALGRAVESAEFFVLSRNAFEQATEAASAGEDAGPTITIGMLEPDASVRMEKRYRTGAPAQR